MIAKYYSRSIAFIIDLALSVFTSSIILIVIKLSETKIDVEFIFIVLFIYLILSVISIMYTKNRTIGERFLQLKIMDLRSNEFAKTTTLVIRFIIHFLVLANIYFEMYLGLILLVLFLFFGFIQPYSKNKQFLWDVITKTVVYKNGK